MRVYRRDLLRRNVNATIPAPRISNAPAATANPTTDAPVTGNPLVCAAFAGCGTGGCAPPAAGGAGSGGTAPAFTVTVTFAVAV